MTETETKTWPTLDEIAFTTRATALEDDELYARIESLKHALERNIDMDFAPAILEDVEPPPMPMIGALTACLAKLRFDLEYALDAVATMERYRDVIALESTYPAEASVDA